MREEFFILRVVRHSVTSHHIIAAFLDLNAA